MAPQRRSRSRTRVRSQANRRQSRKMTVKMNHVGHASAQKASFAAKLGAFICENQKLGDVVGDLSGFYQRHKGRSVNQRVFGVLPFLHLNITEAQFRGILNSPRVNGSLTDAVEVLCNKKRLNKVLEQVQFNCRKQSEVGVRAGLNAAVMESIINGWDMRKNGRMVLNKIQAVQVRQQKEGIIPESSIQWCKC